ncbi:MAG: 23S rRNA (guanosine(2251)-2'-O)-methyltransferase RlmB [Alphaproteobacteria bacterium]|nr:23S rRNA (guanosine(2251)-2'-O)-methyltransferase RlmB [Alphaproteobacteria bacterium]
MKKNHHQNKGGELFLYGKHAVEAALNNPERTKIRLLLTKDFDDSIKIPSGLEFLRLSKEELEKILPSGAVHQGIALSVKPLEELAIEDICRLGDSKSKSIIVALDQVTDPHNIGAILRSAAAFGADALIIPDKNAPQEGGALAKAACGALEIVPLIRTTNLVRALESLKRHGYWAIGMDGSAEQTLSSLSLPDKCIIILGSEGEGMRRLTIENCDFLTKLPISPRMESLNVSNAAAVALYEASRKLEIL